MKLIALYSEVPLTIDDEFEDLLIDISKKNKLLVSIPDLKIKGVQNLSEK